MKKLVIQSLTAIIASTAFTAFADQQQAICDSQEAMQDYAHCAYISVPGIPDGSCKFIRIDTYYNSQFLGAVGQCQENISPSISSLFIPKSWVGTQDGLKPGKYSDVYMQCDNQECQNVKTFGVDNFTLNADKTSTPYKFTANADPVFGAVLPVGDDAGYELNFLLSLHNKCNDGWGTFKYCGSIDSQVNVNKYVKFTDNTSFTIICANNQTRFGFGTEQYDVFTPGTQHLQIFQCDNAQCSHPIVIGKDNVSNDEHGNVDHTSYTVKLNPAYGDNCTPQNVGK